MDFVFQIKHTHTFGTKFKRPPRSLLEVPSLCGRKCHIDVDNHRRPSCNYFHSTSTLLKLSQKRPIFFNSSYPVSSALGNYCCQAIICGGDLTQLLSLQASWNLKWPSDYESTSVSACVLYVSQFTMCVYYWGVLLDALEVPLRKFLANPY